MRQLIFGSPSLMCFRKTFQDQRRIRHWKYGLRSTLNGIKKLLEYHLHVSLDHGSMMVDIGNEMFLKVQVLMEQSVCLNTCVGWILVDGCSVHREELSLLRFDVRWANVMHVKFCIKPQHRYEILFSIDGGHGSGRRAESRARCRKDAT